MFSLDKTEFTDEDYAKLEDYEDECLFVATVAVKDQSNILTSYHVLQMEEDEPFEAIKTKVTYEIDRKEMRPYVAEVEIQFFEPCNDVEDLCNELMRSTKDFKEGAKADIMRQYGLANGRYADIAYR